MQPLLTPSISYYQNFAYKAITSNMIFGIGAIVAGFSLSIDLSNSNDLGFIRGPAKLTTTIFTQNNYIT